jgi:hypothetical protein
MAETSYAKCGDLRLAYQVFGDGPVELVFVGPMVFHVEVFWAMPEFKAFGRRLGHGLRGPRQRRAARCARHLAAPGGGSPRRAGGIGRGRAGINSHSRPSHRDAPLRSRSRDDGQADTMDRARGGPLHPDGSELNSYPSQRGWHRSHEAIAGIERLVDDVIAATDPRAWQADASPAIPGVTSCLGRH